MTKNRNIQYSKQGLMLGYLNISGNNQVEFFLESVTFQFHARMLSSEIAQSLKSYGHFSDLVVRGSENLKKDN